MFYSQFILAKKGPLGTIWIAAHLERKLRKNQVADTDIGISVDSILFPEMPIALRLSSHLLLGVVRIYSKKVNYLFDDCSEALLKVKQAFRSTAVDLPPEESTAPYHSITLPETFDLDDFELPDSDLQGNYVDQHISSKDQITLQDTMEGVIYSTSKFGLDERFGDGDASGLDLDEELLAEKATTPELAAAAAGASHSGDDPQASGGIGNEHLDDYDGDNEPVDYAQGPSTPGLWEEPNLPNVQETSACDDHQEPENHTITQSAVKETLENVFQQHQSPFESHVKSPPNVAETEHHDLGSAPFTQLLSTQTVSKEPTKVDALLNQHVSDKPPGFQTANDNHQNQHASDMPPGFQTANDNHQNQHVSDMPPGFQTANDNHQNQHVSDMPPGFPTANDNHLKHVSDMPPGFQTANVNHQNFVKHQGNQENTFHPTTELESSNDKVNHVGTPLLYSHDSMPDSDLPSLRPCNTFPNHDSNVEGSYATEALNRNFQFDQNHHVRVDNVIQVENINNSYSNDFSTHVTQREVQAENINRYANDFSTPVSQREVQVENISSYNNDLPAPEKRLSLPHWLSDVPKSFVPETTPIEKDITSGTKRSFTESSMTDQSLNLNESSGFYNTNMPPQSLNLNASSGQSLNMNQSSGIFTTNMSAPSINMNQSSGFFTTNTPTPSINMNQSSGFFATNTTVPGINLNQSSGFFPTNTTVPGINLNQSSSFFTTNTTAQSLNSNQSSGFFNTNTTAQSSNLNQSSAPFTINMSGQPVVNDDDLLSSILVGRKSSILKMKPSPPVATQSTKRRRATAPKIGVPKRKVLMDDNMVLHGDTIRQQLTNTEDIRRLRKKAPCTRSEISMLEKQFLEDDIFSEPILTGVSTKLASLHNQLYNLSKIVVSHVDASLEDPKSISEIHEKNAQLQVGPTVPKENVNFDPVAQPFDHVPKENVNLDRVAQPVDHVPKENVNFDRVAQPVVPVPKENVTFDSVALPVDPAPKENVNFDPVAQSVEFPTVTDNRTYDNTAVNSDYYASQPSQMAATEHVAEPESFNSEHLFGERTAMEIDPKSFPDADVGVPVMHAEVEPPTHADVVPSDTFDMSTAVTEVQVDASLQTNAPGVDLTEKVDLQSVDMDANSFKSLESNITASESNVDVAPVNEVSEEKHDQEGIEYRKNEEEIVHDDAALTSNVESGIHNSVYNGIFGEDFGTGAAYDTETNLVLENALSDEREKPGHVTFETTEMNVEDIPTDNRVDDDEFTHPAVENNTDFLNFDDDDDDGADVGADYGTDVEATRVIDNSGWSTRTKAVAKYLQIMFDKEGERGRNMVSVNNLLVGKTRKEASRMFFETLVLKTKDYIHVEQADPFETINVFPRSKLLKSDF